MSLSKNMFTEPSEESRVFCSLEKYMPNEIKDYSGSNRIKIAGNKEEVKDFIKNSTIGKNKGNKLLLGKIGNGLAQKIHKETNVDLSGFNLELRADDIKHLFKEHGSIKTETLRGQRAVTIDDVLNFADIIHNFDRVITTNDNGLRFIKKTDEKITAITLYAAGNKSLSLKTMWINKKRGSDQATNAQKNLRHNVQNDLATASTNNI